MTCDEHIPRDEREDRPPMQAAQAEERRLQQLHNALASAKADALDLAPRPPFSA